MDALRSFERTNSHAWARKICRMPDSRITKTIDHPSWRMLQSTASRPVRCSRRANNATLIIVATGRT